MGSYRTRQRARTTLEDFTLSYFPYNGLRVPEVGGWPLHGRFPARAWQPPDVIALMLALRTQDLFKFLDVLVWVEATIYQLDEDNESLTMQGQRNVQRLAEGASRRSRHAAPPPSRAPVPCPNSLSCMAQPAGLAVIIAVLRRERLCDERVEGELMKVGGGVHRN